MKAAPDNVKMIQYNCKKAVNPVIAVAVGNMDYRDISGRGPCQHAKFITQKVLHVASTTVLIYFRDTNYRVSVMHFPASSVTATARCA